MTTPKSFTTLSEFLLQAGTEYLVIDVSRTRALIDNQRFFEYETNGIPFACPRQGSAWLCIVFWNKQVNREHYIWFLKLPVDEQSLLVQAARDQFLHIVSEALGQQLQSVNDKQAQLPNNPFVFAPSQQMLSDCNALIRQHLQLDQREGAKQALNYLKAPNVQPWTELSVQDMSDLASNIDSLEVQDAFVQNFAMLPHEVCVCLCSSFEGIALPAPVANRLLSFHQRCETDIAPMLLRALASTHTAAVTGYIQALISRDKPLDIDTLVVIAGRHWQVLSPEQADQPDTITKPADDLLLLYFEKVASADSTHALFRGIFADMVQLPILRVFLLAMIRSQRQSDTLKLAVATLFNKEKTPNGYV